MAVGREAERTDLILLARGIVEDLGGVVAVSAIRAAEALVGDSSLLDTGRGNAVGRLEESSVSSSRRTRFGLASSWSVAEAGIVLNGLVDSGRPITGGGIRVAGSFPAVRGLSGSSRSALELLLFRDCAVGLAKPGRARKDDGWFAIESIFLN